MIPRDRLVFTDLSKKRKLLFGKAATRYIDTSALDEWAEEKFCLKLSDAITEETKQLVYICSKYSAAVGLVKKVADIKNLMLISMQQHFMETSIEVSTNKANTTFEILVITGF